MSFTSDIKAEICQVKLDDNEAKAQLCALLQSKGSLHMNWQGSYISVQMENAGIIKHIYTLIKRLYKIEGRLSVLKKMQLKKNNMYRLQIYESCTEILNDLGILTASGLHSSPIYKWIRSEKNARAYLQGCFLGSGSINSPKTTNYHLEMSASHEKQAYGIQKILERFYLPAKVIERKNVYVIYIKQGDKIADFLRLCNATSGLFLFEDNRIQRDFYNQLTRLDNCEVANEMKTFKAAKEQLACIQILEDHARQLQIPEKILQVMEIRKKHPEASINELCDEAYREYGEIISKSGMKHRLSKIKTMAKAWRSEDEEVDS
ncbi:DNA-binding protein WhiA [Dubosiella newyorkensis]|uniref:Probable cell division protein WhiA n=1 Tax=Dubosiella newyorkensis TaxID=1862672 RepID=A0A1U7NQL4_9FIRM|nr:DNA-binding protein WhiA [Dubosiella newyorkensis]OLU47925.1 DNA-binding protein WhiA [Dubosiella newyorkensis]